MSWHGVGDFLAMGGYGLYVWGAYAVTAVAMAIEPVQVARRHAAARRALGGASGEPDPGMPTVAARRDDAGGPA